MSLQYGIQPPSLYTSLQLAQEYGYCLVSTHVDVVLIRPRVRDVRHTHLMKSKFIIIDNIIYVYRL